MNPKASTPSPRAPRLSYSDSGLDRASELRGNEDWIEEQRSSSSALFLPVWRYRHAISPRENGICGHSPSKEACSNEGPTHSRLPSSGPRAIFLPKSQAQSLLELATEVVFLGLRTDGEESRPQAIFAADVESEDESRVEAICGGKMLDLRRVGPQLERREAAMLAHARGLMYWHRHHRFCSRCGAKTQSRQGGHVRRCNSESCGKEVFPRLDPAVIVLVEHRPAQGPAKCLLGQGSRWPKGSFSTLAGFMEPGESLEETVTREIFEEVGVEVHDVAYQGSQPWPFPSSLMLGFRAQASSLNLTIDLDEIADARWFTAGELRQFGEWQDDDSPLRLPRKDSIARHLVDSWIAEQMTTSGVDSAID